MIKYLKRTIFKLMLVIFFCYFISINTIYCDSLSNKRLDNVKVAEDKMIVRGTVINIIITSTLDGLTLQILEIDNGKKYLLPIDQGMEIGKNFDIELEIAKKPPHYYDEISSYYSDLIPIEKVRITAIPVPGKGYKLKYPLTIPPEKKDQ